LSPDEPKNPKIITEVFINYQTEITKTFAWAVKLFINQF